MRIWLHKLRLTQTREHFAAHRWWSQVQHPCIIHTVAALTEDVGQGKAPPHRPVAVLYRSIEALKS